MANDYFYTNGSSSTFLEINQPSAIYQGDKTYVTWQGTGFDAFIAYYDHTLQRWSSGYFVGDTAISNDSHGAPAMIIDDAGYFHIFYGTHTGNLLHAKSTNSLDITSWTAQSAAANSATYPQAIKFSTGVIYLFYRAGFLHTGDWVYETSADNGATWSAETNLIDGVAPETAYYCYFRKGAGDDIHVGFLYKDDDTPGTQEAHQRYNIYYMHFDGTNWNNINGVAQTLPLSKANVDANCLVRNSGANHTEIPTLDVDAANNPYLLYLEGSGFSYDYKFASWNGAAWVITDTTADTDHLFDAYALDVKSSTIMDMYIVTGGTAGTGGDTNFDDRGGNIEKWTTSNGGTTWSRISTIISNSDTGDIYNSPMIVNDYNSNAIVVFSEWTNTFTDFTNKIYLYGDSGFVTTPINAQLSNCILSNAKFAQ